jgi:two-component system OmpR family response regulator
MRGVLSSAPTNFSIFLYEDDLALAGEIVYAFANESYVVTILDNELEVLQAAAIEQPAVFVLDRMIGDIDSIILVERLRREGHRVPVLVISSLTSVDDRIAGLRAGGDDYLIKPFAMGELIARVESLLRRTIDLRATLLNVGSLTMDIVERTVLRGTRAISLAPREFSLLEYFMRRPNQVITRSMILEEAWKFKGSIETNVVDVHIGTLRKKIDIAGEQPMLINMRGIGFSLKPDAE